MRRLTVDEAHDQCSDGVEPVPVRRRIPKAKPGRASKKLKKRRLPDGHTAQIYSFPEGKRVNQQKRTNAENFDKNTPHTVQSDVKSSTEISKEKEQEVRQNLFSEFQSRGLPEEAIDKASTYLAREFMMERCRAEWAQIPSYREAKAEAKKRNQKITPLEYFDQKWRPYLEAGYLYQHMFREYDPGLLSDMRGHCRRHGIDFEDSGYRLPTISEYYDDLAPVSNSLMGEEAAAFFSTLRSRSSRASTP